MRTIVTEKSCLAESAGLGAAARLLLGAAAAILASCTNSSLSVPVTQSQLGNTTSSVIASPTPGDSYSIASIVAGQAANATTTGEIQLFINTASTAAASEPISSHCVPGSSDCICQFKWVEINPNAQTAVQIPRSVQTTVDLTQTNLIQCPEPSVWSTDIASGTNVSITVVPAVAGAQNFSTNTFTYVMGTTGQVTSGSGGGYAFSDSTGLGFENVFHYTCFDSTTRGMGVVSRLVSINNGSTDPNLYQPAVNAPLASDVCYVNSDGSLPAGCDSTPVQSGYTAQAAYYNLYNIDGDYNASNGRFYCPQVAESLSGNGSVGSQNQFWPLDTNFALAQSPSTTYPVGVEAFTKLSNSGGDPSSNSSTCFAATNPDGTAASSSSGGTDTAVAGASLVQACLGFAAQPNTDGSCPTLKDSNGYVRATYRLRRYTILYPQLFEASGLPMAGGTPADTIYVLDRPVSATGVDPIIKPDTMLGPKPCPYAYYDRTAETSPDGVTPRYAGTNDPTWTGKDVDGDQFPNFDSGAGNALSCSAIISLPNSSGTSLSLATVNKNSADAALRSIFIRPITAWTPHYEEDTSFLACAPQSWPVVRDPPLHFARMSTGNVAYCAEVYPTQNPNVSAIDPALGGKVLPYTSHTSKNAFDTNNLAIASCVASTTSVSIPTNGYPASANTTGCTSWNGWARHPACNPPTGISMDATPTNQTCDRTVSSTETNTNFPLLAPPAMVESALQADPGYMCQISFDNNTGGNSKVGLASPTQGCCGPAVRVYTGTSPPAGFSNTTAHLEPDPNVTANTRCQIPAY